MPVDYYPQKTVAELLVILDSVQKRASVGALFITTGAGIQQQRSFQGSASTQTEVKRVLFSLHLKDPDVYQNPYLSRVRRTRVSYC